MVHEAVGATLAQFAGGRGNPGDPGQGTEVPLYILGSSLFGAQLAAAARPPLRLRLALRAALPARGDRVYREDFKPSEQLSRAVRDRRGRRDRRRQAESAAAQLEATRRLRPQHLRPRHASSPRSSSTSSCNLQSGRRRRNAHLHRQRDGRRGRRLPGRPRRRHRGRRAEPSTTRTRWRTGCARSSSSPPEILHFLDKEANFYLQRFCRVAATAGEASFGAPSAGPPPSPWAAGRLTSALPVHIASGRCETSFCRHGQSATCDRRREAPLRHRTATASRASAANRPSGPGSRCAAPGSPAC